MNSDSYFTIGKTHRVCQDYARHGEVSHHGKNIPYAIVSDGCSASPDSDIGARILTLSAIDHLTVFGGIHQIERIAPRVKEILHPLSKVLDTTFCGDATLLSLTTSGDMIKAYVAGDGVVAARKHDGTLSIIEFKLEPGPDGRSAPNYPSYLASPTRYANYIQSGYAKRRIPTWENGVLQTDITYPDPNVHNIDGNNYDYGIEFPTDTFAVVAIFSDGVESFKCETRPKFYEPVGMLEVVNELMTFKSLTGEFVTRRAQKFFRTFCPAHRWIHTDDVSMAAMTSQKCEDANC